MKKISILTLLILIAITTICFGKTPEEARTTLAQLNLPYNEQTFIRVIEKKDNVAVSLFLDAGIDPNYITNNKMTPLLTAALYNNIEATRLLLGKPGIDPAWKNSQGRTAVDIAYLFDNSEIVRLFKEKGIEVLASKKEMLSAAEINRALKAGESVVARKNITYVETLSAKASDGFLSPVEAQGKAYLITPFCQIANAKITELKTFESTKPEDLNRMVNSYQVRVLFSYTFNNYKNLSNIKIYMSQNGNILFPYAVRRTLSQPEAPGWANSGLIADFSGHEIDPAKPIEVRVITKAQKDLLFAFKNENGNNREYFVSENSKYKWE